MGRSSSMSTYDIYVMYMCIVLRRGRSSSMGGSGSWDEENMVK